MEVLSERRENQNGHPCTPKSPPSMPSATGWKLADVKHGSTYVKTPNTLQLGASVSSELLKLVFCVKKSRIGTTLLKKSGLSYNCLSEVPFPL